MRRYLAHLAVVLALTASGCDLAPSVTTEVPAAVNEDTFEPLPLGGQWQVHATMWTDCPDVWHRTLPYGVSRWQIDDTGLTIEGSISSAGRMSFLPTSETTFQQVSVVTAHDCAVTERLDLVVDKFSGQMAQGVFTAHLSHDGSASCKTLAATADLPQSCETILQFQARRMSGP